MLTQWVLLAAGSALWTPAWGYATLIDGFEGMSLGPLDGQDGWVASQVGPGSEAPVIVDFSGKRAALLSVGDAQGDESLMYRRFDGGLDLVSAGYRQIRVSFQIYRPTPAVGLHSQNLYWWFMGDNPDYGMQWDAESPETSLTIPVAGFANSSLIPSSFDAWAELAYEYDFDARTYSSWYAGVQVDYAMPMDGATVDAYREMNGYLFDLWHQSPAGTGRDRAYIADLKVQAAPEPTTLGVCVVGLVAIVARGARRSARRHPEG